MLSIQLQNKTLNDTVHSYKNRTDGHRNQHNDTYQDFEVDLPADRQHVSHESTQVTMI